MEVKPDTAKLTNVIVTGFQALEKDAVWSEKVIKMFVKNEAKISSRVGDVNCQVKNCVASCFCEFSLRGVKSKNHGKNLRRLAAIEEEIC